MTTLTIRIEPIERFGERFAAAFKSAGAANTFGHSFSSYEAMHKTLSPKRLEIVRVMSGQGKLSYREVARRVERDFKGVHNDLTALIKAGLVDREEDGVVFPYDTIHFDFNIKADAA
jgi:predicted transcriptional regulator